jgi:DNA (cytosine-5)-methyltransferase 1
MTKPVRQSIQRRKNASSKAKTAIDLFAGSGGLTLGLKKAGFNVIAAVEIDELAVKTYSQNHPEVLVFETDIRKLNCRPVLRKVGKKKGEIDLLAGCPPCQGFSTLKTLNGSAHVQDKRNDLVFEYLRFVREIRPRAVMLENVPGLAADRRMKKLSAVLDELGYKCRFEVLDAQDYGVPQRRKRLILVGSLYGEIGFGRCTKKPKTVWRALRGLAARKRTDPLHNTKTARRSDRITELISLIPKNGGSRASLPRRLKLRCHRNSNGFKDVYGRMAWSRVAPTITTGCVNPSKGRFLHPRANRAITLREAAVLQSFPKSYFFSLAKGKFAVAAMIGNALPPEFIRRHASKIHRFLEKWDAQHRRSSRTKPHSAQSVRRRAGRHTRNSRAGLRRFR